MAVWPTSLPQQVLAADFTESADANLVRSDVDVGPAKLRRRYTAEIKVFQIGLVLTADQVATLETFYDSTLGAVDPFDWTHPRTLAAASLRFRSRPEYRALAGGWWRASFALELLP
jgi:hypothetical protein